MAAYDASPVWLRAILRDAVANWSAESFQRDLRDLSPVFPASRIRGFVLQTVQQMEPEDTWKTYGPHHPEANAHGKRLKPYPFAVGFGDGRRVRHDR